ncbi:MAG: GatB/YqeY domain-containing protein [Candidatus Atribacteria bacterium]|nr:GatB/YqeY domain-containing protein [Candidatus Atribacteria bacterium]
MIKERLVEEMKKALKEKNFIRLDTIRLALAEIKNKEIEKRQPLDEDESIQVLKKGVKKIEDSLEYFERGNRPDLIRKAKLEISTLQEFLPAQLTIEEIEALVDEVLSASSEKRSFGLVMKEVMSKVANRADGAQVSAIVKQKLSEV